ncbi:MAG: hypothetical protein IV088_04185 [Hydrogenophaga sp.]|uniref:hypothetical protein n=1 Tax=Hydrogenophaga sp. TaxID=1904254 RepID=UPI0025C61842|nr:hypothetical protein [Hydrogenophaga sp.]MBT9550027.1 hypothetical protein [Hydrogenophaga sp.]
MTTVGFSRRLAVLLLGLMGSGLAQAQADSPALEACLRAWGDNHPFGSRPTYRTLATSVKVFGRGPSTADREVTDTPALILVNPGVNVMGASEIELLNPNGWYCLRSAVNVMGGMDIKLHCRARLASASGGTTVWGGDNAAKGVTVMGAITVERVGCPDT